MEALHRHFLYILKSALLGNQISELDPLTDKDWKELSALAVQHKVLPMVYDAVCGLPQLQGTPFLDVLKKTIRQQVVLQAQKNHGFLTLYRALQEAGVTPLVIKGIICRNLYPKPDYRISADEDLLILPDQFPICHQILTRQGMQTTATPEQLENDYEIPYRGTTRPLYIELHRSLFSPEAEAYGHWNGFFADVFDRMATEQIDGVAVGTLAPTDHLFYLIAHALKHFLHSGFGIRQICDIIMYANHHGSTVDWGRLLEQCNLIHAERFAAAIFEIGRAYLVFDPDNACYPHAWRKIQVSAEPLLEDILSGGIYGSATKSRQHSSNITLNAVAAEQGNRKAGNPLLVSLFPPKSDMCGRYPWLKKDPWLLPLAWADRILRYRRETGSGDTAEPLKIGNTRIELLREYGIIR